MDTSKRSLSRDKDILIPRALFTTTTETFVTDIEKLEQILLKIRHSKASKKH